MYVLYFNLYFIDICSHGSDWQYFSMGANNGLAPAPMVAQFTDRYA